MKEVSKTATYLWYMVPPETRKAYILIIITVMLIGCFIGVFILYHWKYKEMESDLYKEISVLKSSQREMNYIKEKYPEWQKMLADAEKEYSELKSENKKLREQLAAQIQAPNESFAQNREEELAPGYRICMDHAKNDFDMKDCSQAALEYWDKKLNITYKVALGICKRSDNPEECISTLNKMEKGWIVFHDIMGNYIYDGGIIGGGGTIHRVLGIDFLAQETKRQCKRLQELIRYEE